MAASTLRNVFSFFALIASLRALTSAVDEIITEKIQLASSPKTKQWSRIRSTASETVNADQTIISVKEYKKKAPAGGCWMMTCTRSSFTSEKNLDNLSVGDRDILFSSGVEAEQRLRQTDYRPSKVSYGQHPIRNIRSLTRHNWSAFASTLRNAFSLFSLIAALRAPTVAVDAI